MPEVQPRLPSPPRAKRRGAERAGLTLVEVLVAMTIVAVVAVIVMPQVLQFFEMTQRYKLVRDLDNLRVAVQTFNADTRSLPRYITQLTYSLTTSDSSAYALEYRPRQVAGWNGPYTELFMDPAMRNELTADAYVTGHDARIYNALYCYEPQAATILADCPKGTFLAVWMDDLSGGQFNAINDIIDGEAEPDTFALSNGYPVSWQRGKFRFVLAYGIDIESSIGIAYYLVAPSQEN